MNSIESGHYSHVLCGRSMAINEMVSKHAPGIC